MIESSQFITPLSPSSSLTHLPPISLLYQTFVSFLLSDLPSRMQMIQSSQFITPPYLVAFLSFHSLSISSPSLHNLGAILIGSRGVATLPYFDTRC